MATGGEDCNDDIQEVTVDSDEFVGDVNCPLCLQEFTNPRMLPCMHTFCQHCLSDYILSLDRENRENEKRTHFPCPVCRQEIQPPCPEKSTQEWAAMFKQSPLLAMVCEGKEDFHCSMCELDGKMESVTDICVTCIDAFCASCTAYHRNLKATKGHTLVSKNKMNYNPHEMKKFVEMFTCIEHGGKEIEFYCEDHKAECCARCAYTKHKVCNNVHDLKDKQMIAVRSPQHTVDEMKMMENHLNKIVNTITNEQSEANKLKEEIDALRIRFNNLLDKLLQRVDMEETHKQENTKKKNQCLSLAAAINSSYRLLQLASQHGSDTQLLLTLIRSEEHLKNYKEQMCIEWVHQSLELHPDLSGLLSLKEEDVAKVSTERRKDTLPVMEVTRKKQEKSLEECQIEMTHKKEVMCPDCGKYDYPFFSGAVYLPKGNIMLVDTNNRRCCLYNADFEHISHYIFQLTSCGLHDASLVSDTEVVVSLCNSQQLQFLSVEQEIKPTSKITTRFCCTGIATLYKDRIIVSGKNDESNYYWSIISKTGDELSYHDIGKNCSYDRTTYLALDESKTRIYMSCKYIDTLFCFNLDGDTIFTIKENYLRDPTGIGLGGDNNIYVVGSSSKMFQILPDGTVLEVCETKFPYRPQTICFSHTSDIFFITDGFMPKEEIYLYKFTTK
ncbi:hypothetical protein ACJMK2_022844 [Sinanodonta woodiana]|uniref:Uncharacterized protein n=1 Tax=Sinanodonta woodiana TaxID=1069815 RepID=A0ABD3TLN5_SINWO